MLSAGSYNFSIMDLTLFAVLLICCYTDLRVQKVYNLVLFPAALAALVISFLHGGPAQLVESLQGMLLGLGLLLLPFAWGGIGAGDVKLLSVVGAFKGPEFVLATFVAGAVAGGVYSVFLLIKQKKFLLTLKKIYYFCLNKLLHIPITVNFGNLETAAREDAFPYALAISTGVILVYFLR